MQMALRIMFAADWHLIAGARDDVEGRGPSWPALDTAWRCLAASVSCHSEKLPAEI